VRRLAILGASGHGKVVAEAALLSGWDSVSFYDDAYPDKKQISSWSIDGTTSDLIQNANKFDGVHIAIGDNLIRHGKFGELTGLNIVSVVHPDAVISSTASIGKGAAIFGGVVINADSMVGIGAILNTGCTVDHDCSVGEFSHISPGVHLAGHVVVGDFSWLGIGSSVIQCLSIGSNTIIGAGSVVVKDIPASSLAYGFHAQLEGQFNIW